MNKRHLHHVWRTFRKIRPVYFLVIAAVSGIICAFALRDNNQHMIGLRDTVYQADKSGTGLDVALNNLRTYVYAHMNTNLSGGPDAVYPPLQLKFTYDRLVTAESARVAAVNTQVYTDAQHYCEQLYPGSFSGGPRVPCITAYVSNHGAKSNPIPDSLYKFNFASPSWSPDLAGWSMVIAIVSALVTAILFVAQRWFKQNVA
jgi:hypothetical protein